jgi:hypothetical protein
MSHEAVHPASSSILLSNLRAFESITASIETRHPPRSRQTDTRPLLITRNISSDILTSSNTTATTSSGPNLQNQKLKHDISKVAMDHSNMDHSHMDHSMPMDNDRCSMNVSKLPPNLPAGEEQPSPSRLPPVCGIKG